MQTYRVAIIGAGHRAGSHDEEYRARGIAVDSHAWAYRQVDQCSLVAAADPDPAGLESLCKLYGIPAAYPDWRTMLDEVKPDIVSICTPTRPRPPIISHAAERGVRGIYAEKALCSSMAEADSVLAACRNARVAFAQGTNRRWDTRYGCVRQMIADGQIGEPSAVMFLGQSLVLHGGSHIFDTMLFLMGDPTVEYVQGELGAYEEWGEKWLPEGRKFFNKPIYDKARNRFDPDPTLGENDFTSDPGTKWAFIQFSGGSTGHLISSPSIFDFMVLGSMGRLLYSEETPDLMLQTRTARFGRSWQSRHVELPEHQSSTVAIVRDLIHAVETGTATRGPIEIAHRGMEMALALAESHVHGGSRVALPLANRTLYVPNH